MARLSAAEYIAKWQTRTKAATQDYTAGVKRVSQAPGVKAAAAKDLMRANINAAIDNGVWERQVSAVPLQAWQDAAANKGAGRIAAGVDGATGKMQTSIPRLLQAVDTAVAAANRTPRGDLNANIQRAVQFMQTMSANAPKRQARG